MGWCSSGAQQTAGKQKEGPTKTLPKVKKKKKKKTAKSTVSGPVTDGNQNSDNVSLSELIKKLKPMDIDSLRNLLGIYPKPIPYQDEAIQSIFGDTLENLSHLSVEVVETSDDEAGQPQIQKSKQTKKRPLQPLAINNELQNALFP